MAGMFLLCRMGLHRWQTLSYDERQQYITGARCGRYSEKITLWDTSNPTKGAGRFG